MISLALKDLPTFCDRDEMDSVGRLCLAFRALPKTIATPDLSELSLRTEDRDAVRYVRRMQKHAGGSRILYKPNAYHYVKDGKRLRKRLKEKIFRQ